MSGELKPITPEERRFMEMAVEEATKSRAEDERTHPKVGVLVVKNGEMLEKAHRGEIEKGEHAEFIALEKKLSNEILAGADVYTTLEPCTTRNHPKIPCAERLIERKVKRVFVGILDPNTEISGKGVQRLREANIEVVLFPGDLMAQLEDLNRNFIRSHRRVKPVETVPPEFVEANRGRSLDDWYRVANTIYWNRNFHRDVFSLFTHLVEVIGGLSLLASQKKKVGATPENFIPKAFAWWMAVCGKVGVKSVSDMLWAKFPAVCPYCHRSPHDPDECTEMKLRSGGVKWDRLQLIGISNSAERPGSLSEWQKMFSKIFPAQQTEDFGPSFGRLAEELGELAEALRVFPAEPGYFLSEAADVFAWLMHIQNIVDQKAQTPKANRGDKLETLVCKAYPDKCADCGNSVCNCPPILDSTIGRIAHEVPTGRGSFDENGFFMTPDKARIVFQLGRPLK